jgi:hypothetical protein
MQVALIGQAGVTAPLPGISGMLILITFHYAADAAEIIDAIAEMARVWRWLDGKLGTRRRYLGRHVKRE